MLKLFKKLEQASHIKLSIKEKKWNLLNSFSVCFDFSSYHMSLDTETLHSYVT